MYYQYLAAFGKQMHVGSNNLHVLPAFGTHMHVGSYTLIAYVYYLPFGKCM